MKMTVSTLLLLITLPVTCCSGSHYLDNFPYPDDGKSKPEVEVVLIRLIEQVIWSAK